MAHLLEIFMAEIIAGATDWRKQIRLNQRRTRIVIALFIFIYLAIGLLVDMYIYSNQYQNYPLSVIFHAIVTFKLFPYATLITMGVALICLFVSYMFYDRLMLLGTEYHEITSATAATAQEKQLYNVVEEMKVAAGLRFMPRVFIIEADYMNAFASGYSEKSAMVAITRGLIEKLDRSELQAVMAHELSHIRHLDIKLTMTAALLSNLILIVIDILFYNVVFGRRRKEDERLFFVIILLRYLLPLITVLLLLYLSRTREYMADAGCVELMRDNLPLAHALLKIHQDHLQNMDDYKQAYGATAHENIRRQAYLYDPVQVGAEPVSSVTDLFSTHPNIQQRLKALGVKVQ